MKRIAVLLFLSLSVIAIFSLTAKTVLAEKVGLSPESGATSRISTLNTVLTGLGFGSTSAGTWGDWGAWWNRIYWAAKTPANDFLVAGEKNGSGTGSANCASPPSGAHANINCYTKALGGVDDYNNSQTIPADTYEKTWTTCNSGNNYCGTGRTVLNNLVSQDPNTNLVWSPQVSSSSTWFVANDCIPPGSVGNLGYPSGTCVNDGDISCICVKQPGGSETGCAAYDGVSGWRLPYQKELMQSYIDGSWGNLANAGVNYWSSTTISNGTSLAWTTNQNYGNTVYTTKTTSIRRSLRPLVTAFPLFPFGFLVFWFFGAGQNFWRGNYGIVMMKRAQDLML